MSVDYIEPVSPDPLIDRYGLQSAAPAKLAHINYLQDQISESAPYVMVGGYLNHGLGTVPTFTVIASGSLGCPVGCQSCIRNECLNITITNISTGNYRITLSTVPKNGFDVLISPLKDARQNIGVLKVSNTEIIVSVYDIPSGSYVNNAFDNTYLQFLFWN